MSEIERLHQARIAREASARSHSTGGGYSERRDPTEWSPRGDSSCEWVEDNMRAVDLRSAPLNYESLAQFQPGVIEGIEANQRAALIRTMEGQGLTVDERAVKVHWQLVVEGYGFPYPDGFVHPDAPDDVQADGREAWARIVKQAGDSMTKFLFVKVWRRKNALPVPEAKALQSKVARCTECREPLRVERSLMTCDTEGCPGNILRNAKALEGPPIHAKISTEETGRELGFSVEHTPDDVVDAEIVCTDFEAGDPDEPDGDPADTCRQCHVLFADHP